MKQRAPRNRTITCTESEVENLSQSLLSLRKKADIGDILNKIIQQDFFAAIDLIPDQSFDLVVLDPPYNLTKNYNGLRFQEKSSDDYAGWFLNVIQKIKPKLKKTASIYVCADWKTSMVIAPILDREFLVKNRITWEREKGRGAKTNWKNNTEDIWFCTLSDEYYFDVDAVKVKKKVIAPYRNDEGAPKDWEETENGNFRLTHPSNIWTDITVPFWSMPENTDHPTQKPEKLIAKLILASTKVGDVIFDPFLGSGTTAVAAAKLNRNFVGIEVDKEYCSWAVKRLNAVHSDSSIQGYADGVFWERNSLNEQPKQKAEIRIGQAQLI